MEVELLELARTATGTTRARTAEGWVTAAKNSGKSLLDSDADLQGLLANAMREKIQQRDAERPKPAKIFAGEPECAICLEPFPSTPGPDLQLPLCGHVFCSPCITKWLQANKNCPMCRELVLEPAPLAAALKKREDEATAARDREAQQASYEEARARIDAMRDAFS